MLKLQIMFTSRPCRHALRHPRHCLCAGHWPSHGQEDAACSSILSSASTHSTDAACLTTFVSVHLSMQIRARASKASCMRWTSAKSWETRCRCAKRPTTSSGQCPQMTTHLAVCWVSCLARFHVYIAMYACTPGGSRPETYVPKVVS